MNKKDFSAVLNDMKDLTIGQIIKLILNLKYRTIMVVFGIIVALLGGAFTAGKYAHQKDTAVMLESPFAMRIFVGNIQYDFENLTLVRDPAMVTFDRENKIVLSLREIKSAFDIIPVGTIIAQTEIEDLNKLWKIFIGNNSIISNVKAKSSKFKWNGHKNDYNFKEGFVSKDCVRRYYSDGCVLEYKVDKNRKSIPSSFVWISISH